jgi:DNA-binding GntR family transcriptional regulator
VAELDPSVIDETPIPRTKLSDEVAHRIREAILSGRLKSDERIVQEEWAQRLGVSRMPVRDAIARLEAEGLVTVSTGNGVTVASMSEHDIEDAYEFAAVLVGLAGRRAAVNLSSEDLAGLRRIHGRMIAALGEGDRVTAQECTFEIFRQINQASGSARLLALIRLNAASVPLISVRELPELDDAMIRGHAEILDALEARDADRAGRALEDYTRSTRHALIESLRQLGFFG